MTYSLENLTKKNCLIFSKKLAQYYYNYFYIYIIIDYSLIEKKR